MLVVIGLEQLFSIGCDNAHDAPGEKLLKLLKARQLLERANVGRGGVPKVGRELLAHRGGIGVGGWWRFGGRRF